MSNYARFLFINALVGALLGCIFVAGLLYADMGGVGSLVMKSEQKLLILAIIFSSTAVNVGLMYMTTAILLATDDPGK
ncbi:MAG: hypothetical protein AAFR71_06655 [Pseudomonadota bacterium]